VIELHFTQITPPGVSLIPLRGKALVVEPTGRVIRTELTAGSRSNVSVTTTEFEFNAALRIDVPVRLRDVMPASGTDEFIGRAVQQLPALPGARGAGDRRPGETGTMSPSRWRVRLDFSAIENGDRGQF
jgi:hypothetical protein